MEHEDTNAQESSDITRTDAGCPEGVPTSGYVYFIRCEGARAMKIGVARDPLKRLASLQTSCPLELKLYCAAWERDAYARERELHQRFARHRMRGEWFHCEDEIRHFAQAYAKAGREGVTWRNLNKIRFHYPAGIPGRCK